MNVLTYREVYGGTELRVEYRGHAYIIPKTFFPLIENLARKERVQIEVRT